MGALDGIAINDALISHQIDLLRLEAGTASRVVALLTELQKELAYRLITEDNLTAFTKARLQALLKQATDAVDRYYAMIEGTMAQTLQGVANVTAGQSAATLNTVIVSMEAALPTETFLARLITNALIMGAPSSDWWQKQGMDIAFRFSNVVRQGVVQGLTNEQIVARIVGSPSKGITGIMDIARSNARSLVHTSIMAVSNAARVETFETNMADVADLMWLATLDTHTCIRCMARDMHTYAMGTHEPLDGGPPWEGGPGALHWGDRCVASLSMRPIKGMPPLPVGGRASSTGPVAGNTSFADYLDRMGKDWQDRVLGPGRAALYRSGKLTLEQLLGPGMSPLTLAQLRAKYA